MKKTVQLIFSTLLLIIGITSLILFAQLFINFKLINLNTIIKSDGTKGTYLAVCVLMGIATGLGLILSIFSLIWLKGSMWIGINALGTLIIGAIMTTLTAICYDINKNGNTYNVSEITLNAVTFLPLMLSSTIFIPSFVGYLLAFKKSK